jgi:ribosomal protein S19
LLKEINNFMARARRKFFFIDSYLTNNLIKSKYTGNISTKSYTFFKKNIRIPKMLMYSRIRIHKGNQYITRSVSKWMIGRNVGEFVLTRKPFFFPTKKSSKKFIRR